MEAFSTWGLRDVFATKGNTKLGRIVSFSLPAPLSCPGHSRVCRKFCYALRKQSHFTNPAVQDVYLKNWELSLREDFADIVVKVLARPRARRFFCRLHVVGDFYDEAYARAWLKIARNSPHVIFGAYTRSWRIATILPVLRELGRLQNFRLWFSSDSETGVPPRAKGVRVAYMRLSADDVPPGLGPDLFFREHSFRGTVEKHVGGILVCPPENGVSHSVTCEKCQICYVPKDSDPSKRTRGRFALNVISTGG